LCAACHLAKTVKENSRDLVHGTNTGYIKRKCRCIDCHAAHAAYNRSHRAAAREKRSTSWSYGPKSDRLPGG
jgi:hypothetical protein